jgi:hypothetical protein
VPERHLAVEKGLEEAPIKDIQQIGVEDHFEPLLAVQVPDKEEATRRRKLSRDSEAEARDRRTSKIRC